MKQAPAFTSQIPSGYLKTLRGAGEVPGVRPPPVPEVPPPVPEVPPAPPPEMPLAPPAPLPKVM